MGLTRRQWLTSLAALLGVPAIVLGGAVRRQASAAASGTKKLVVVFAEGGWDVSYCLDPKLACTAPGGGACTVEGPEVDESTSNALDREAIQTFGEIPIVVNGVKRPAVTAFFEDWHPRCHVINGIWTGSIAHDPCRTRLLTGTANGRNADAATITGFVNGDTFPLGSVDLSGWSMAGPLASSTGRIGFNSQIAGLVGDGTFRAPAAAGFGYPLFAMDPSDEDAVEGFLRGRAEALRRHLGDGGGPNDRALDDFLASMDRGARFRAEAAGALDGLRIGQEAGFSQQLGIAVDLLAGGLCQAVTIDTREAWDTHDVNSAQHGAYDRTFRGLSGLMATLEAKQMLDDVVVAVISEMTRTPLRNAGGGKDHWGHTSAMLMGAVRGNAVSGGTDHLLESLPMSLDTGEIWADGALCKYDNFVSGLLELVGVDPQGWLPGVVPFRGAHQ